MNSNVEVNAIEFAEIRNQVMDLQYCTIDFLTFFQRSQVELSTHRETLGELKVLDAARWKEIADAHDAIKLPRKQQAASADYLKNLHATFIRQKVVSSSKIDDLSDLFGQLTF